MHSKTLRGNIHKRWRVGQRYIKKHRINASDLLGYLVRDMVINQINIKEQDHIRIG